MSMPSLCFPTLDAKALGPTRDALHAYARVMGSWAAACRPKRKHWWHASLRPSLDGLRTGSLFAGSAAFDIELNFRRSLIHVRTAQGAACDLALDGQSAEHVAHSVQDFLCAKGAPADIADQLKHADSAATPHPRYAPDHAVAMGETLRTVAQCMATFRGGIREECSPIQVWPHHFDLSLLWLPGDKVPGQNPDDEENADEQMNFGFAFGDAGVAEPYFYITAYPAIESLSSMSFSAGAHWYEESFSGIILSYNQLLKNADPANSLVTLWRQIAAAR